MIRATIDTQQVQRMDEVVLHDWLAAQGFKVSNRIKRTDSDGMTLFEQFPAPGFTIKADLSEFIDTAAEDRNKRKWEREGII